MLNLVGVPTGVQNVLLLIKKKMSQIKMSKFVTNFTIKNSKVIFVKNQTLILVRFDYMAIKTFQMVETASNFVS